MIDVELKLEAGAIQRALLNDLKYTELVVVPNYYYNRDFEADVFAINKNLYASEYEIKVDKYDLLNDHKKTKRLYLSEAKTRMSGIVISKGVYVIGKYDFIKDPIVGYACPKKFFYVITEDLQDCISELPLEFGLIVASYDKFKSVRLKTIRESKVLSKTKLKRHHVLKALKATYYRYVETFRRIA